MKFLADNMLGRLTTWLRLLGYDTLYLPNVDDAALARIARAENRILLTRDVELTRRRGLRFVLIESDHVVEQVRQVFHELNLTAQAVFSRCAECNVPTEEASTEAVCQDVPAYVLRTHTRFRRCPQCRRVYWRGTHWARMVAQIEEITDDIEK